MPNPKKQQPAVQEEGMRTHTFTSAHATRALSNGINHTLMVCIAVHESAGGSGGGSVLGLGPLAETVVRAKAATNKDKMIFMVAKGAVPKYYDCLQVCQVRTIRDRALSPSPEYLFYVYCTRNRTGTILLQGQR